MINSELAQIFSQMSDFLDVDEKDSFRSRAYAKAARLLEFLEEDVKDIYDEGGAAALKEMPGIGEGIALKIEEYIKTGHIKQYEAFRKKCPVKLEELKEVEGLGFKKIKVLYKKLGIKNLKDLTKAAKQGKISRLEGFGAKSEENILQGIAFARAQKGRLLLGQALPLARRIISCLKQLSEVSRVEIAGSVRRRRETIGDIDMLAASTAPEKVMDVFVSMPEAAKVWAKGLTKSSVRLKSGIDCDLRIVKKKSFGAAWQYFTGSKEHNIVVRRLALKRGLKLNEYGLYRKKKRIAGRTEKRVYRAIGLRYIEPELRTNSGEIEAALKNKLPKLIGYDDIQGDCHCHTTWSDGLNSIEEMAAAAKRLGYRYLAICDHGRTIDLREKDLLKQTKAIDKINAKMKGFRILKGIEVDVRADGSLLIKDEALAKLDIVVAAVHTGFKMNRDDMTKRLIKAVRHPHVDMLGHPTGRLLLRRRPYQFDFDAVLKAAKESHTALEINAHAQRLDLKDSDVRRAIAAGVKLIINTDAHAASEFNQVEMGIAMARRGWASKSDILNTHSLKNLLAYFYKKP